MKESGLHFCGSTSNPIVVTVDAAATNHIDLACDGVTQSLHGVILLPLVETMAGLVFVTRGGWRDAKGTSFTYALAAMFAYTPR